MECPSQRYVGTEELFTVADDSESVGDFFGFRTHHTDSYD